MRMQKKRHSHRKKLVSCHNGRVMRRHCEPRSGEAIQRPLKKGRCHACGA